METIRLESPDLNRGKVVMQALAERCSTREFAEEPLSLRDLSDLLWAANGINRPESGKRTAPSAMNRQDIKVYACTADGTYRYHHETHSLDPLTAEDVRPDGAAPLCLVLVADQDTPWGALDAGIVSQNISLFCSGVGLATYPRATMDAGVLRRALKLTEEQMPLLCHPVGYFKR